MEAGVSVSAVRMAVILPLVPLYVRTAKLSCYLLLLALYPFLGSFLYLVWSQKVVLGPH
jgi:hypothetical protein